VWETKAARKNEPQMGWKEKKSPGAGVGPATPWFSIFRGLALPHTYGMRP